MRIAVASGKGGTGKTLVATNLALVSKGALLVDLDVEEPNAYLFFDGRVVEEVDSTRPVPRIDSALCDLCGKCAQLCEYRAIAVLPSEVLVFDELCKGCGGCSLLCPRRAITEKPHHVGKVIRMADDGRELLYGELKVGEAMAVPLIRDVKRRIDPGRTVIVDCPPGASCPAVESVRGADLCVLVTEPTPFGLHDLDLAVRMLGKLRIPSAVIINKEGAPGGVDIDGYCERHSLPIVGRVPFSREIAVCYSMGELIARDDPGKALFSGIMAGLTELVGRK